MQEDRVKALQDAIPIINDLLQGDESAAEHPSFQYLTGEDVFNAARVIVGNPMLSASEQKYFIDNMWKINYVQRPPKVEEFLTPQWLGVVGDQIYPHVKDVIVQFMNPLSKKRVLALSTAIGFGKAQSLYSMVQTPYGPKQMKDVHVGDVVSTPNGGTAHVIAIHPQGKIPLYEVTFRDGRKTVVSEDHLWTVRKRGSKRYQTLTTKEIIGTGLKWKYGYQWFVPLCKPIDYAKKKHLISPYIMGALLGDGCFVSHFISFACDYKNIEIVNRIQQELPQGYSINHSSQVLYYISKDIPDRCDAIKQEIRRLSLYSVKSHGKFIPKEYLHDSVDNRIALLQGLLDTDGTSSKLGKICYYSSCKQLIMDVQTLVRSLGGTATLRTRHRQRGLRNTIEYETSISFSSMNIAPFFLSSKNKRVQEGMNRINRTHHNTHDLSIRDIKQIKDGEAQCITIDSDDGLYLTDDYIVTHNSFLSTLIAIYIVVNISYMRNPKQFFGLNEAGSLVIALASFTKEKVGQLLLQPFSNILRSSPMFERTLREDRLEHKQREIDPTHIAYTSAGRMGAFQFPKDIHITTVSERSHLLGLNILLGIASEISFWIQKGISVDEIWSTFTDLRERVNSRFHSRYLSGVILDSSPLDLSLSPIDKWLYTGEVEKDPEVMFVNAKHWDVFPERYPEWRKTGKTFPIFRGDAARPPRIIGETERKQFAKDDIIDVPIDKLVSFQNNIKKQVADYAAYPAGGLSKVIEDVSTIENIFSPQLSNIYDYVYAPSNRNPEHLIWNQIVKQFFIMLGDGKYEFHRAPRAPRTIHIDLSESGDVAGFAMSHFEVNKKGEQVVVNDFAFGISPEKSRINIDAIGEFIIDLRKLGHLRLEMVTADQYQSASILQRLKREDITCQKLSVDRDMTAYRLVVSWMENGRVKAGRNILLKNNFLSLVELVTNKGNKKIDHTKGTIVYDDGGDWKQSYMGVHAKDISDAFVGSIYNLITSIDEIPTYQWVDDVVDTVDTTEHEQKRDTMDVLKKEILSKVNKKFSLKSFERQNELTG